MAKTLVMDVLFLFGDNTFTVTGMSPQEAFNLLHMPSMSVFIVSMSPILVEVDELSTVSEPENKE